MNAVALTGRLTADVELMKTPSGVSVCSFRIAVKRPKVKDKTDFFTVVAWRNNAENICQYFHKGDRIEFTGTLTSRNYEDKNGNKRTLIEVEVDEFGFVESKGNAKNATTTNEAPAGDFVEVTDEGVIPF